MGRFTLGSIDTGDLAGLLDGTARPPATVLTDITERKRAEEELTRKEAQLRVALDKALVPGGDRAFAERRDPDTLDGELLDSIRRAAAVWR